MYWKLLKRPTWTHRVTIWLFLELPKTNKNILSILWLMRIQGHQNTWSIIQLRDHHQKCRTETASLVQLYCTKSIDTNLLSSWSFVTGIIFGTRLVWCNQNSALLRCWTDRKSFFLHHWSSDDSCHDLFHWNSCVLRFELDTSSVITWTPLLWSSSFCFINFNLIWCHTWTCLYIGEFDQFEGENNLIFVHR